MKAVINDGQCAVGRRRCQVDGKVSVLRAGRCDLEKDSGDKVRVESSLVAQCLGLGAFTAVAQVQSLIAELRSRKSCSVPRKSVK